MIVYSQKIIDFMNEIKSHALSILETEASLKVSLSSMRFYNAQKTYSYPLKVVIFNNNSMLGYFDPNFLELGFHECLMQSSREQLFDIIRHEIAHYLTFITYGNTQHHGPEFRSICQKLGWGENVFKATTCLDDGHHVQTFESNPVLSKIQKLLALSTSSNEHEAELAMIKSQQLLLKHNLDIKYISEKDEDKIFLKRIMKQSREDASMRAIARILETFFVSIVINRTSEHTYLEIVGTEVNLQIAEYVSSVLQIEFEKLWKNAQKTHLLRGAVAKKSFIIGIAIGYCNKIEALKKGYDTQVCQALMVLEKQLVDAKSLIYPRLKSVAARGSFCPASSMLGEQAGKHLNINPAVGNSNKNNLIGFQKK